MDERAKSLSIEPAGAGHAPDIRRIYNAVRIPGNIFSALTQGPRQRDEALAYIRRNGGFINPPDEQEMEATLNHGMVLVARYDDAIVAYNRYVTDPGPVHRFLCKEFSLNPDQRHYGDADFVDSSLDLHRARGRRLTQIRWIDRAAALEMFAASLRGLEGHDNGRLAWAVDAATHPDCRKIGVMRQLIRSMPCHAPTFVLRAYRMFEIMRVDDRRVDLDNRPSRRTFHTPEARHFAITEEEIELEGGLVLGVRWNHWLRPVRAQAISAFNYP